MKLGEHLSAGCNQDSAIVSVVDLHSAQWADWLQLHRSTTIS
jgi:hypothetical protein